ncbi:hypothetical protein AAHH72_29515 [Bacillus cereus]
MTKVTVELTEKQVEFLKLFSAKQYEGAEDNQYTCDALHVVQKKETVSSHIAKKFQVTLIQIS